VAVADANQLRVSLKEVGADAGESGDPEDPLSVAEADQLRASLKQAEEAPVEGAEVELGKRAVVDQVAFWAPFLMSRTWIDSKVRSCAHTEL